MKTIPAFFAIILFGCNSQTSFDVSEIKGLPYEKAREKLLNAGWQLAPKPEYAGTRDDVIAKYPETMGCAVDRPFCRFAFIKSKNECLAVITVGEDINDFFVKSYLNECEQ
ncbi:MAG: hypothetical protein HY253_01295 [Burkholderiales bacterium]|nr:hypothetical protein [Burkholderiales bacterium]